MNWAAAMVDDLQRFPPGGSLWYGRLAYNRMIVDNLRRMVDPNYAQSFQERRPMPKSGTVSNIGAARATQGRAERRTWERRYDDCS